MQIQVKIQIPYKNRMKCDLSVFDHGMVNGASWASLGISKVSRIYTELCKKQPVSRTFVARKASLMRMARLVSADKKKSTVIQITTLYSRGG